MQSVSSSTTRPPEPIMAPASVQALVVHGQVGERARDAPARRAADLHGLEAPSRPACPPPISSTICRIVHAHRHLDQAAADDLPGQGEDLGARARAACRWRGRPPRRRARIHGTAASVSTLLTSVGRPHSPAADG